MNPPPRRAEETAKISLGDDLGPAAQNPSNVDRGRRAAAEPDEIGIPSGYPERSLASKRFPVPRRPRAPAKPPS